MNSASSEAVSINLENILDATILYVRKLRSMFHATDLFERNLQSILLVKRNYLNQSVRSIQGYVALLEPISVIFRSIKENLRNCLDCFPIDATVEELENATLMLHIIDIAVENFVNDVL